MKVSAEILQKIKNGVNIVEVIGEHVVLRKAGSNHVGLCPFHAEKSPSFSVSEQKQLYHCYGCKKGGDLLGFVMDMHGLSFPEAVVELAERAKVKLSEKESDELDSAGLSSGVTPEQREQFRKKREKLQLAYRLNRFAASYYHQQLLVLSKDSAAKNYLSERGVQAEYLQNAYMGYASNSWHGLAFHLKKAQAPIDLAIELGLIRPSNRPTQANKENDPFDLFRNRIIFPIIDLRGKVCGFGGRLLPSESDGPKYLNSSDSFVFNKSKQLYGLFQAQKHIREKDEVFVVEGYFDVMAFVQAGLPQVVATCGTALTADHLNLLSRFTKKIVIVFDSDRAGKEATERAMELALDHGIIAYGAQLPDGKDADELVFDSFLKKVNPLGVDELLKRMSSAVPLIDERIESLVTDLKKNGTEVNLEEKVQAYRKMGAWLGRLKDPISREVRIESLTRSLGVPRSQLMALLGGGYEPSRPQINSKSHIGAGRAPQARSIQIGQAAVKRPPALSKRDLLIFEAFFLYPQFAKVFLELKEKLSIDLTLAECFDSKVLRYFFKILAQRPEWFELLRSNSADFLELFLGPFKDNYAKYFSELEYNFLEASIRQAMLSEPAKVDPESLESALARAAGQAMERISQKLCRALSDAEQKKEVALEEKLKKEYLDVQRNLKEFYRSLELAESAKISK